MLDASDTIIACSTPPGRGALSVIRLSGESSIKIAEKLLGRALNKKVNLVKLPLWDGYKEKCVLTIFKSPNSYTGENLIEISCHGNPLIVRKIIDKFLQSRVRMANPGEFTLRSYMANKMSLEESEAVIQVINANSDSALIAAQNTLNGGLRKKIKNIQKKLRETRVVVETLIDFTDEDADVYLGDVKEKIEFFKEEYKKFGKLMENSKSISDDIRVVLAGPPNVGKSTLINALTNENVSIVSEIPGTTRDVVKSSYIAEGIRFVLEDTAGLRKSSDKIEEKGIKLAKKAIKSADIVIYLGLAKKDFEDMPVLKGKPCIKVLNKMDLKGYKDSKGFTGISAKTGKNLSLLKSLIVSSFLNFDLSEVVAVNARHLSFVKQGSKAINAISPSLISSNLELVAENLKECDALLGNIYDPISADDLLGKIFNTFCIGK